MHIGDRWVYQPESDNYDIDQKVEIIGKQSFGQYEYYVFENTYTTNMDYIYFEYYRKTSDGKIFTYNDGNDCLYIDFNKSLGDSWDCSCYGSATVTEEDIVVNTPVGIFAKCITIYIDPIEEACDEEQVETYAPQIGLIKPQSMWFGYKLKSAYVNGVSYEISNFISNE